MLIIALGRCVVGGGGGGGRNLKVTFRSSMK